MLASKAGCYFRKESLAINTSFLEQKQRNVQRCFWELSSLHFQTLKKALNGIKMSKTW